MTKEYLERLRYYTSKEGLDLTKSSVYLAYIYLDLYNRLEAKELMALDTLVSTSLRTSLEEVSLQTIPVQVDKLERSIYIQKDLVYAIYRIYLIARSLGVSIKKLHYLYLGLQELNKYVKPNTLVTQKDTIEEMIVRVINRAEEQGVEDEEAENRKIWVKSLVEFYLN